MRNNNTHKRIQYINPTEMAGIKSNKKLLKKLKAGHRDAKALRGKFVEISSKLVGR